MAAAALVFLAGVAGAGAVSGGGWFGGDRDRGRGFWFRERVGVVFSEFGELAALFVLNLGVENGFASCNGG